ncbi:MAG: hypothetical protein SNH13_06895 [Rikenellaceae bacterium]
MLLNLLHCGIPHIHFHEEGHGILPIILITSALVLAATYAIAKYWRNSR